MANGRLDVSKFKEALILLDKFATVSKLYEFSNYVYISGNDKEVTLVSALVLGEAISSGLAVLTVPYEGEPFGTLAVSKVELSGIGKNITSSEVFLNVRDSGNKYIEIKVGKEATINLATSDIRIPPMFENNIRKLREGEMFNFPAHDIQPIVKELGKDIRGQVISHNYQGIYVTKLWSFVTNGLYMTGHIRPKNLDLEIYLPRHSIPIIGALPKKEYQCSQEVLGVNPTVSPHLYIKGEGIELYFQEWVSKDIYPIKQMVAYTDEVGHLIPMDDIEKALTWIVPKSDYVQFRFREGIASSLDNKYQVNIEVQDIDTLTYTKIVLPSKANIKSYGEVEMLPSGLMKLNGAVLSRICTPVVMDNELA